MSQRKPQPHNFNTVTDASFATSDVHSILGHLKLTLGPLEGSLMPLEDTLTRKDTFSNDHLVELRNQMHAQEHAQLGAIDEIQNLLDNILEHDMLEHITHQVKYEISLQIDAEVEKQVAALLKIHVPQDLQNDLAEQKSQLEHWKRELHNSESRRINGTLTLPTHTLHPLVTLDGRPSTAFPETLHDLMELDPDTVRQLMREYEIPEPFEDGPTANINCVLQFFGTSFFKRHERAARF